MNREVFLSILAMDSYNRGYGVGVDNLPETDNLGQATLLAATSAQKAGWEVAGFYAIAYSYNGETIISYRGTDTTGAAALINDIVYGWTFGGGFSGADQVALGIKFYQAVAASSGAGTNWRNAAA
jgi:hypothetical protein